MSGVVNLAERRAGNLALALKRSQDNLTDFILRETDPNRAESEWLKDYRRKNLPNIMRGLNKIRVAEEHGIATMFGMLWLVKYNENGEAFDYGLVSCRLVTTAGVNFIVDAFQNSVELETFRYHGVGTTNTAENVADTALAAECTTVLNPDSTRATGTLAEGASANIYRTVATNNFDGAATIVEHGIFSQAATGGGTLLDRSVFAGIGVVNGNALQSTYDFTITAGG